MKSKNSNIISKSQFEFSLPSAQQYIMMCWELSNTHVYFFTEAAQLSSLAHTHTHTYTHTHTLHNAIEWSFLLLINILKHRNFQRPNKRFLRNPNKPLACRAISLLMGHSVIQLTLQPWLLASYIPIIMRSTFSWKVFVDIERRHWNAG
jgi:hypothetical protein